MEREALILKWLDNTLSAEELVAFKALEDYDELIKLQSNLEGYSAPSYNTSSELEQVLSKIRVQKTRKTNWLKPFLRVAAIVAVCFSVYYFSTTLNTNVHTQVAQKTTITLPDNSTVALNAESHLTYNKKQWQNQRALNLEGEAFFKVAKGAAFDVNTELGKVTVYGTAFNVKQRDNNFEVVCYEGVVGVTFAGKETKLRAGDSFTVVNGTAIPTKKIYKEAPSWLNNESQFKSIAFKYVVAEFERQYGVDITLVNIDSSQTFTGAFTHNAIDVALKSLTLPLNATYSKDGNSIIIRRDN